VFAGFGHTVSTLTFHQKVGSICLTIITGSETCHGFVAHCAKDKQQLFLL